MLDKFDVGFLGALAFVSVVLLVVYTVGESKHKNMEAVGVAWFYLIMLVTLINVVNFFKIF